MTRTPVSEEETLLDWALRYASLGWRVLPLGSRSKAPVTNNGLMDSSTHPDMIRAWWSLRPNANIGLRTGERFDVIDVDGDVGRASLDEEAGPEWRRSHSGPVSLTGKGEHYLILPTRSSNRAGLLPKVDYRGVNGYIVAPPSIHPDGRVYRWDTPRDYSAIIPERPDWIERLLVPWEKPQPKVKGNPYDPARNILTFAENQGWQVKREGSRYAMRCPFSWHNDSKPSFKIYSDGDNWTCYGCKNPKGKYLGGTLNVLRNLMAQDR